MNVADSASNGAAMIARFGEIVKALPNYFDSLNICAKDGVLPIIYCNRP